MHGYRRTKLSPYGQRLREKQKLKRYYGLYERQFRRLLELAERAHGNTGEQLQSLLERRLDNIVCRLGLAVSRPQARQFIRHGHFLVNGRRMTIPSYLVRAGDTITVRNHPTSIGLIRRVLEERGEPILPDFLELTSTDPPAGRVKRLPTADDSSLPVDIHLVVEFCSR
jgi:small subunit ribosomal protein S4